MDPLATNYNPNAVTDDGSCVYYYDIKAYSGIPCNYEGLIDSEGDITTLSVNRGYETVIKGLALDPGQPGYLSPYEASIFYPDFDGDEKWTREDLRLGLNLVSTSCYEQPDPETTASVSFSWENISIGETIPLLDGIGSSYLYAGEDFGGEVDADGNPLGGQAPDGQLISLNPESSPSLRIDFHLLDQLNAGQEIHVAIEIEEEDEVSFINTTGGTAYNGPYNGNTDTMWTMRWPEMDPNSINAFFLSQVGSLEEIIPNRKYLLKISGDAIIKFTEEFGFNQMLGGTILADIKGPVNSDGVWLNGIPLPPSSGYYEQPMLLGGDVEDVRRQNNMHIDVSYHGLSNATVSDRGNMILTLGWLNQAAGSKLLPPVEQFVDIDQPFPFTGDLCDYPLLLNEDGVGLATGVLGSGWGGVIANYNHLSSVLIAQISDPDDPMTQIEATHHLPNFAMTSFGHQTLNGWGPVWPNGSWSSPGTNNDNGVNWADYRDYFIENNGLGDSLNFEAYGGLGEPFLQNDNPVSAYGDFTEEEFNAQIFPVDKFIMQGYLNFLSQTGFDFTNACVTEPEPTLEYNDNPCDYPLIGSGGLGGFSTFEGNVTSTSYDLAYDEVQDQIEEGLTLAEATFLIPSVGGVMLTWTEFVAVTTMDAFNTVLCGGYQPFTGNICDYPYLQTQDPADPFYQLITGISFHQAWVYVFEGWVLTGIMTPQMATYFLPDLSNDGFISTADLLLFLPLLVDGPIDCSDLGEPGAIKPTVQSDVLVLALDSAIKKQKKK